MPSLPRSVVLRPGLLILATVLGSMKATNSGSRMEDPMADVVQIAQGVLDLSRAYQEVAGALLGQAQALRSANRLDDGSFKTIRKAYESILAHASDMLVDVDDDLGAEAAASAVAGAVTVATTKGA
jgi:hypothetical protein